MIFLLWLACGTGSSKDALEYAPVPEDGTADAPADAPGDSPGDSPDDPPADTPDDLPDIADSELGDASIESTGTVNRRQLKRMTVAQARDSMVRISGNLHWGDEDESNWDVYADTLGVADYQLRVESDRSASVMFQKFLDDAATDTCLQWVTASGSTFFTVEDTTSMERGDVRTNIVGLRWQIQGKARDESDPIIDDYEQLFFTAHERTDSLELSWQTVCVAMFTHPDFFMY